ncbi:hypothetical protein QWZ04_22865 [Vibrio tapetis subsp. quintayensis]|uniref:hypothetical protein n=1 Tax=Vibrio tapetis TaxID=52443 RepID=UPI0025B60CA6|nr:hypothetical protein [Vibrio tapetis]MDN3683154.1 hypothetical protein [Vibrio tapetis subsp. quintayensis]
MDTNWHEKLKLDTSSVALVESRFVRTTQSQTDVAKWMLDEWMPMDSVVAITGLPLETVVLLELEMTSSLGADDWH